ncbi:MAG: membrane protein insertase YidC [Alphaproteobacteria bacterium]|nr:MAG: membrane protein insertase YidC [Alphaproteobacteria bacterium]
MDTSNRNTILAIVLSLAIIVAWQFFYVNPKIEAERQAAEAQRRQAEQTQQPAEQADPASPGVPVQPAQPGQAPIGSGTVPTSQVLTRDLALAANARVAIETSHLTGSINLKGARFDDLRLKRYRETIQPGSPLITLLSPSTLKDGYFAEFGYVASGSSGQVPGPETVWSAPEDARLTPATPVTLTWTNEDGVTFSRTISVDEDYMFTLRDQVANGAGRDVTLSAYGRVTRFSQPESAATYILHEGVIGVFGEQGLEQVTYDNLEGDRELVGQKSSAGWLGITDKYWAAAMVPAGTFRPAFRYVDDGRPHWQSDFLADPITIAQGANETVEQRLFAGAKEVAVVDGYQERYGILNFDLLIDWGWFYFITKPMFWLLDLFYRLVGNFGVAILISTVVIKAALFPLANMSYKSMAQMKKLQPEMMALRDRYKDDKVKQQQEMMALYKREKVNPAAGCWPILVQIPIFFALYKVLYITIEMRHAPFFGWVRDLAAPDPTSIFNLFGVLPFEVPAFLLIGVWPLIMGITMFLQMQMNPMPPDPTQALIFKWMPLVFTFMLASFPAGLVIYWAWNNTLSILQQGVIMKRHGVKIELWDNLVAMFRKKPKPAE